MIELQFSCLCEADLVRCEIVFCQKVRNLLKLVQKGEKFMCLIQIHFIQNKWPLLMA